MTNRDTPSITVDIRPCLERWENEGGRVSVISNASRNLLLIGWSDGVKTGENETFSEKDLG